MNLSRRSFLVACGAGWACREQAPPPPAGSDRAGEIEWHIQFLTNQQRNWQKLAPFEASPVLASIARAHSRDMLARDFFNHVNPEGRSPKDRIVKAGLSFRLVAENIYATRNGSTDAAESASHIVTGWMNHPGHRRNILDPALKLLGVGVAVSDDQVLATQLFAS